MIPHSTHHFLLHCRTTTRTWIGLRVSPRPIDKVIDQQTLTLETKAFSILYSQETTPISTHSFLLVKGFRHLCVSVLASVHFQWQKVKVESSFLPNEWSNFLRIFIFPKEISAGSLVQGCTPALSSPHIQFEVKRRELTRMFWRQNIGQPPLLSYLQTKQDSP